MRSVDEITAGFDTATPEQRDAMFAEWDAGQAIYSPGIGKGRHLLDLVQYLSPLADQLQPDERTDTTESHRSMVWLLAKKVAQIAERIAEETRTTVGPIQPEWEPLTQSVGALARYLGSFVGFAMDRKKDKALWAFDQFLGYAESVERDLRRDPTPYFAKRDGKPKGSRYTFPKEGEP